MTPERTALFLMANLGSEVERLLQADEVHNESRIEKCLERAHRTLGELEQSVEMRERLPEIRTLHMVLDDFANQTREYRVEPEELRSYFTPFALRLMEKRIY